MKRIRRLEILWSVFVGIALSLPAAARDGQFTPLSVQGDDSESKTGLWFCPEHESAARIVPLKTRVYATRESVTDGVAMRVEVKKGSTGTITFENSPFPPGTAGITLFAKASMALDLTIKGRVTFRVTREWDKIDISWKTLGSNLEERQIGYLFKIGLAVPASEDCWYIIDRLGCEGPAFDPSPAIDKISGPDETINTKEIAGNAEILAPTVARLKAKRPFKIIAFGDSVTAGAQAQRDNWNIKGPDVAAHLYFSHLARLLGEKYGYKGISYVQKGHGGWTARQAKDVAEKDLATAGPGDVIILQFGGNDLGWAGLSVDAWLADLKALIVEAKKHTSQVIIMSITTGSTVPQRAEEISRKFTTLAKSQKVAWVDITRWSNYRGYKYAWAYLANPWHPDFMGHIMMAELFMPLFGGGHFDWPEYAEMK